MLIEIEERYCEIAAKRMAQGVLEFGDANAEACGREVSHTTQILIGGIEGDK